MPRSEWTWAPDPSKIKVPIETKLKVTWEMDELIEEVLKKKYVKKPLKDEETNYIVDLYSTRLKRYFYFCAKYHSRSKCRIADFFEVKFARLEYTHSGYNLAYMRHTGKWWELYQNLTLKEALKIVATEAHFEP